MTDRSVPPARVVALLAQLARDAEAAGYNLNPDAGFTRDLVQGLAVNEERYGYRCCPCRLAQDDRQKDLDIICPCDYRDPDLNEWGTCYCALYVSDEVLAGARDLTTIPERRPPEGARAHERETVGGEGAAPPRGVPVWRCRVCGYLCGRDEPPGVCPICKATKDRFERFW